MIIFVKIARKIPKKLWPFHSHLLIIIIRCKNLCFIFFFRHQICMAFITTKERSIVCLKVYTKNYIFADFIQSSTERVLDVKYVCTKWMFMVCISMDLLYYCAKLFPNAFIHHREKKRKKKESLHAFGHNYAHK